MAIAIVSAERVEGSLVVRICPNTKVAGECGCAGGDGEEDRVFEFPIADGWVSVATCAREALLLVLSEKRAAGAAAAISELRGKTLADVEKTLSEELRAEAEK